jgi:hypothetical protein
MIFHCVVPTFRRQFRDELGPKFGELGLGTRLRERQRRDVKEVGVICYCHPGRFHRAVSVSYQDLSTVSVHPARSPRP